MERLGKILHVSLTTGNLITKTKSNIRIGEKVFDSKLREVGTVFDVFGPVTLPYIAIKPSHQNPDRLANQTLYLVERKR